MATTFEQWLRQVDRELIQRCGLSHRDLADFCYRDSFEDECDPAEVAVSVLVENDFPFEEES